MKENKITLKTSDGKKSVFDVLFEVETDDFNYIAYTNNTTDKDGNISTYFGKYCKSGTDFKNVNKKEEETLFNILVKFRGRV